MLDVNTSKNEPYCWDLADKSKFVYTVKRDYVVCSAYAKALLCCYMGYTLSNMCYMGVNDSDTTQL